MGTVVTLDFLPREGRAGVGGKAERGERVGRLGLGTLWRPSAGHFLKFRRIFRTGFSVWFGFLWLAGPKGAISFAMRQPGNDIRRRATITAPFGAGDANPAMTWSCRPYPCWSDNSCASPKLHELPIRSSHRSPNVAPDQNPRKQNTLQTEARSCQPCAHPSAYLP